VPILGEFKFEFPTDSFSFRRKTKNVTQVTDIELSHRPADNVFVAVEILKAKPKKPKTTDPFLIDVRKRHKEAKAKLNNSQVDIKEGFIYAVTNPKEKAIKIGKAIDYESRLRTYQTYDSGRQFRMIHQRHTPDRNKAEDLLKLLLKDFRVEPDNDKCEWFYIDAQKAVNAIDQAVAELSLGI
jgi:hypothetical protein